MKSILFSLALLLSVSTLRADEVTCVGLRGVKAFVNAATSSDYPQSLVSVGASQDILRIEREGIQRRMKKVDQITSIDTVLDKVEMSRNSLFFKIDF